MSKPGDVPTHLRNCVLQPNGVAVFAVALRANHVLRAEAEAELERLNGLNAVTNGQIEKRCVISARSKKHLEAALTLAKGASGD